MTESSVLLYIYIFALPTDLHWVTGISCAYAPDVARGLNYILCNLVHTNIDIFCVCSEPVLPGEIGDRRVVVSTCIHVYVYSILHSLCIHVYT